MQHDRTYEELQQELDRLTTTRLRMQKAGQTNNEEFRSLQKNISDLRLARIKAMKDLPVSAPGATNRPEKSLSQPACFSGL
jgi:hypothetical protein